MPLELPHEDRCSFCAYLAGERRYTILEERELSATLVTREQRGVGHVLVIPKEHRPTILDLDLAEQHAVIEDVQRMANAIERAYDATGVAVWQNNGVPSHQSIPHVHFHVCATLPDGGTDWGKVPTIDLDQTEAIAERIRAHLT